MMNRRYWAEIDGQRIYRDSLAAIKRIAQDTADKLGRVVRVGYEDRPPARRNPAPRTAEQWAAHGEHLARLSVAARKDGDGRRATDLRAESNEAYSMANHVRRSPIRKAMAPLRVKANPARPAAKRRRQSVTAYDERLAYFAGVTAARDGRARASNPHYGAEAKAWRAGFDYLDGRRKRQESWERRHMKANPDPGSFLPVWIEQERGRKMRLDYLKATKARRLAKGLRGRDRGGQVKAAERRAEKTGKFAVHISGATINGVKQPPMTLQRASRRAAEALGAGFEAAGYKVTIAAL
jgi:hypothetical protein